MKQITRLRRALADLTEVHTELGAALFESATYQDYKQLGAMVVVLHGIIERAAERAQQEETPPEPVRLCERCGEDHRKLGKTCCHRCGSLLGVDDETGACLGCG